MMKNLKLILLAIILLFLSCFAPEPEPGPVSFAILENFRFQNIDYSARVNSLSGVELIITDQSDYENYIVCSDQTVVNFNSYFVLAGISTIHPHCVYVKEQGLQLVSDTLKYTVTLGDMDCTMPDRAKYAIVVSRNYIGYPIKFIIKKED